MNPKYIYHYTSLENAIKIVESKQLFLFNVFKQKDKEEYYYGGNLVAEQLSKIVRVESLKKLFGLNSAYLACIWGGIVRFYSNNEIQLELLKSLSYNSNSKFESFLNSIDKSVDYYIISFSTSPNIPYLWKNYADNYKGVVLQFDFEYIRTVVLNLGSDKINYIDNDEQTNTLISSIFFKHRNDLDFYTKTLTELIRFIVYSKFQKYKFENEFRITLHNNPMIPEKNQNDVFVLNKREYVNLFRTEKDFLNSLTEIQIGEGVFGDERVRIIEKFKMIVTNTLIL